MFVDCVKQQFRFCCGAALGVAVAIMAAGCGISIPSGTAETETDESAAPDGGMPMMTGDPSGAGAPNMAMSAAPAGAGDPAMAMREFAATDPAMNDPAEMDPAMRDQAMREQALLGAATVGDPAEMLAGGDRAAITAADPAMLAAAAGANPEFAAARGPEGAGRDGEGGSNSSNRADKFETGSAEYVIMAFADAIEDGDLEAAADYVSDRAPGTLAAVREERLSENQLDQLKAYTAKLDLVGNPRNLGRALRYSYRGGSSKVLQFEVEKKGSKFLIRKLTISDAPKRAGR